MNTYRITGKLKARGLLEEYGAPYHSGAPDQFREYIDRPLRLNNQGLPVLAGSSICGVLASLARTVLRLQGCPKGQEEDHPSFIALFGAARGDDDGQASRLAVADGIFASDSPAILIRDRIGVNRQRGSADDKRLFRQQILDGEWAFVLDMEYQETGPRTYHEDQLLAEGCNPDTLGRELLWNILKLASSGWLSIGGQTGIGYGRVCLEDSYYAIYDRSTPSAVRDFALNRWDAFSINALTDTLTNLPSADLRDDASLLRLERIKFCCRLRPMEPLLVKTGYTTETRPSRSRQGSNLNLTPWLPDEKPLSVDAGFCLNAADIAYIPGSSLRGSLRSHVERIVRTLAGENRAWNLEQAQLMGQEFSQQQNYDESDVNCLVSQVFGFSALGGRISFSDAIPLEARAFERRRKLLDHVALDRFTGGAADKAKFNSRPYFPTGPAPDEKGDLVCEIELFDLENTDPASADYWHLGLVLLMLRDMRLGRVYVGHGKNKGFGKIRLESVTIEGLLVRGGETDIKSISAAARFRDNGILEITTLPALSALFDRAAAAWRRKLTSVRPASAAVPGGTP